MTGFIKKPHLATRIQSNLWKNKINTQLARLNYWGKAVKIDKVTQAKTPERKAKIC
jgi:hypothetical protein